MHLLEHCELLPQSQILKRKISANHERRSQRIDEESELSEHPSKGSPTDRKCQ
jgi:hypothetical protein